MLEFLKKLFSYSKYFIIVMIVAAVGVLLTLWLLKARQVSQLEKDMETYKRQLAGQLTEKEKELQAAHLALGVAQSQFLKQEELLEQYKKEKIKTDAEFEAFKKKHNIEIESFQRTIAKLEQQIKNGTTVVEVKPGDNKPRPDGLIDPKKDKLYYKWNSDDGRFELEDQDVFTPKNETFKLRQTFRITGEIYREKVGFLKTNRLSVEEVVSDGKNSDGTEKYKVISEAKVVESNFKYSERAPDSWIPKRGVLGVWGIISTNIGLYNGVDPRFIVGTGIQFLNVKGFGIATQLFFDTTKVQDTGIGLTLLYRPIVKNTQLNFGINFSVHTPFNSQIGRDYVPSLGLQIHLW